MTGQTQRPIRTLIVDDEPDVVEFVAAMLQTAGCDVCCAQNGDQALQEAMARHPDLVLLDVVIPEQDGWLVCSKLKLLHPAPVIVLMTGLRQRDNDQFAEFVHADHLLQKPFSEEDLLRVLEQVRPSAP